jgi:leader peptidase (prepilin peptidase)/N-methyltransferase
MTGFGAWWLPLALAPFIGSFAGVLIDRLPVGAPVVFARSRCAVCGRTLTPFELVPLLSWLALAGRCRGCRSPIGMQAPAIELGFLAVAAWAVLAVPAGWVWLSCALGWALLTLAVIDLRHLWLPDALTLPLVAAGLAAGTLTGTAPPASLFLGAALGFAVPWALRAIWLRWRRMEALGLGDAKLLAAAGAWVGWQGLPGVLLLASVATLAVVLARALWRRQLERSERIPFGPALCLAFWLVWLYGPLVLT